MAIFKRRCGAFSRRWGQVNYYEVVLTPDELTVTMLTSKVTLKVNASGDDVEWTTANTYSGHPLYHLFEQDEVYPPAIVADDLEYTWQRWQAGKITDAELGVHLDDVFTWIDQTTRNAPKDLFLSLC